VSIPFITEDGKKYAIKPAFKNPNANCIIPDKTTAIKNTSQEPNEAIEEKTITANPAAGPLTPSGEPLAAPTTTPPTIPAIIPANNGAPLASAIPKHKGRATKNTMILAGKSDFNFENI
jgi:hypothetical protein